MDRFNFYQDRKVTCWERTHFEIKAGDYEQALSVIMAWQGEDVMRFEDDDKVCITYGETLFDTAESLSVDDNNGNPTIEVFGEQGESIIDNVKKSRNNNEKRNNNI